MPRLRRSDCSTPGIRRVRRGRGFSYHDADGAPVRDPEVLARIAALAIPPAWKDVWICPDANGHLQAVGTDAAGRRQYRYHDEWRRRRDELKFEKMLAFGRALPELRARVGADLAGDGLGRTTVLAAAVRLLDLGMFRVGGEDYAEEHETFGLATLQRNHVRVRAGALHFDYTAKAGKRRVLVIDDPEVTAIVSRLKRRRGGGDDLLAWREGRRWVDVRSDDVNAYLKEILGEQFSAKDFRTWAATVLAAVELAGVVATVPTRGARRRAVPGAIRRVADAIGNTPAVCRASYVDPRVLDRFEEGETVAAALDELGTVADVRHLEVRRRIEEAVLALLAEEERAPERPALASGRLTGAATGRQRVEKTHDDARTRRPTRRPRRSPAPRADRAA